MLRSRVLSGIDTARLANAVARPGIDPRIWVSYAVLTSDPVVVTEANEQDVVVDIMLLPSGTLETARVGATYAGNGFGLYAPLYKDDEVLVAAPSGDPDEGLVVIQRMWSPADLPPDSIAQHPEDWTLIVKEGKNLRLNVQGGGKVYLGNNDASNGVARLNDTTANGTLALDALATVPPAPPGVILSLTYTPPGGGLPSVSAVTLTGAITAAPGIGSIGVTGTIDSASEVVVSA